MTEIPEDVMKAAYDAALSYRYDKATDPIHHDDALQECIARAILAERKRCVSIAVEAHNEWANDAELWKNDGKENAAKNSARMANVCALIAGRINNA